MNFAMYLMQEKKGSGSMKHGNKKSAVNMDRDTQEKTGGIGEETCSVGWIQKRKVSLS